MGHTILIVEDNELNTEMLRRRLEKRGYNVVDERDGNQVTALLEQFHPDMILMDLSLPGMDGWTLAATLKAKAETCAIPIIAVTAHAMPGDREKAIKAGCDDYITKPIDFQLLIRTIERFLTLSPAGDRPGTL
ncbi:MAG: two-component system response regulator [Candidatus Melainabacteria bacterium HGW-Melainabacteria-1]|nr:MAG: two-component system response regulator [Candidatus Melainabacteria bacterium HGW-Melainabacteria-1]